MNHNSYAPWLGAVYALLVAVASYVVADGITVALFSFDRSPISPVLVATIAGAIVGNAIAFDAKVTRGFRFCASTVLKTGIVFLGLRLSLATVSDIGAQAIPIVAVSIITALTVVIVVGKKIGLSWRLSGLIAAGTSICGCTAIVAVAPLIRSRTAETSYAIGTITLFGLVAMFTYPYLANGVFQGDQTLIGLFLGTAIHETAQVAGAGFIYNQLFDAPLALEVATVTKLVRNLSMVIMIPLISVLVTKRHPNNATAKALQWYRAIPLFVVGFATMSIVRTIGDAGDTVFGVFSKDSWLMFIGMSTTFAELCLVVAMAGIGLTTNLKQLTELGFRPFALGFFASSTVGMASIGAITFLQGS